MCGLISFHWVCLGCFWHFCDVVPCPLWRRYRGRKGHSAQAPKMTFLTHFDKRRPTFAAVQTGRRRNRFIASFQGQAPLMRADQTGSCGSLIAPYTNRGGSFWSIVDSQRPIAHFKSMSIAMADILVIRGPSKMRTRSGGALRAFRFTSFASFSCWRPPRS